jgi:DNA-directed RNA polymerase III subunit RPC1
MSALQTLLVFRQRDPVEGVSECIIMGIPTTIGTGLFKLLREPGKRFVPKTRTLLFDNADFSLPV